jgi:hypothetical protein
LLEAIHIVQWVRIVIMVCHIRRVNWLGLLIRASTSKSAGWGHHRSWCCRIRWLLTLVDPTTSLRGWSRCGVFLINLLARCKLSWLRGSDCDRLGRCWRGRQGGCRRSH